MAVKFLHRGFLLIIALLLLSFSTFAQGVKIKEYGIDYSMPLEIKDVYQDSTGYVWISSDDGLAKFDGRSIQYFKDELPSYYVKRVIPLKTGKMIVLTNC